MPPANISKLRLEIGLCALPPAFLQMTTGSRLQRQNQPSYLSNTRTSTLADFYHSHGILDMFYTYEYPDVYISNATYMYINSCRMYYIYIYIYIPYKDISNHLNILYNTYRTLLYCVCTHACTHICITDRPIKLGSQHIARCWPS